jgi:hypothetical protein
LPQGIRRKASLSGLRTTGGIQNPNIGCQLRRKLLTAKRKHYLPYLYQISHILVKEKNPTFLKDLLIVCLIVGKQRLIFLCAFAFFVVK